MYDSITPLAGSVSEEDVAAGFKSAKLGFPAGEAPLALEQPRDGVTIRRDRFNVPHIEADTDDGAVWAVGWVAASHGALEYEVARRNGRIAALRVPNVSALWTSLALKWLEPTGSTEAILGDQLRLLQDRGAEGAAVLRDMDSWLSGYNAQLDTVLSPLPRWTRLDLVALAAFKSDWFGRGAVAGPPMSADSPGGYPHLATGNSVDSGGNNPGGVGDSLKVVRDEFGFEQYHSERAAMASNFAVVAAERSSSGHPILIGGPQIGYMYPAVAFEVDIHSPNIRMRGLTAPSFPGYVFVGRGERFGWTLNVAPSFTGVQLNITMCGDGQHSYLAGTQCLPVEEITVGRLNDLSDPFGTGQVLTVNRTIYGPIERIIESDGLRMAVVISRPADGHDVLDMIGYRAVNYGHVDGPEAFRSAMQQSPASFTFGYVDSENIAAFATCWCVDISGRSLQSWASGGTLIDPELLPSTVNPPGGLITNWNEQLNTPGGDFSPPRAGSRGSSWFQTFDSVRVHTPTSMVSSMNLEATRNASGRLHFLDLFPPAGGSRPPSIAATNRSTAIQLVLSFQ